MNIVPLKFLLSLLEEANITKNHPIMNLEQSQIVIGEQLRNSIFKILDKKEEEKVKNELKDEQVKFSYIKEIIERKDWTGELFFVETGRVITIARTIFEQEDGLIDVEFATAICNPKDQFSKKIGRSISLGRLSAGKDTTHILVPKGSRVLPEIVAVISEDHESPTVREIAKEWMDYYENNAFSLIRKEIEALEAEKEDSIEFEIYNEPKPSNGSNQKFYGNDWMDISQEKKTIKGLGWDEAMRETLKSERLNHWEA